MYTFKRLVLLPETEDCLRRELAVLLADAFPARSRDVGQGDSDTAEEHFDLEDELDSESYTAPQDEGSDTEGSEEKEGDEESEDDEEGDKTSGLEYRGRDDNDEEGHKKTTAYLSKTCHPRLRQRCLPWPERHKSLPRSDPALYHVMPYPSIPPWTKTLRADSIIRASVECTSSSELTLAPLDQELPAEAIFFGKCTVQPIEPPLPSTALLATNLPQRSIPDSFSEQEEENKN
ncbi:hypothetical protein HII31_02737 [Pseudocercospora fuligena]|uniref:Uncharacterized protein n=1 Tax=Pseudocercospora fuligena TaxID=685502 RepID=A0A8H6RQ88_9PEZI|nr:hypothetical protein HII31_02737 [Pseudocercospora fuligena]